MDLAALIISIVALAFSVMALPTVFQMFFGGPKIMVQLDEDMRVAGCKMLQCHIINQPIANRWLRRIKVIRQATDILADFDIMKSHTKEIIVRNTRAKLRTDKEHGRQVTLSTAFPAFFSPIACDENGTIIVREETEDGISIHRGQYIIVGDIIYAHDRIIKFSAEFMVGDAKDELYWYPGTLIVDGQQ